jgi:pectin methylesterase-like acyl-CoA thioesterase
MEGTISRKDAKTQSEPLSLDWTTALQCASSPMSRVHLAVLVACFVLVVATASPQGAAVMRFPADKAVDVNPDTHLVLTFSSPPKLGNSGQVRIYDATNDKLIDTLDMSVPPGPTAAATGPTAPYTPTPYVYDSRRLTNTNTAPGTPSGAAAPTSRAYQLTIIGGFSDGFHFYPVIIHDNVATVSLHHNLLEYNKSYYVQIDRGVLTLADGSFAGVSGKSWTFTTKKAPPPADRARLVVSGDGSGDFNTVQGALDFVPDKSPRRVTIYIRNGNYEEIVYFRNKANITLVGEDREKVVVSYANNEVFNPHPSNISTNEWPGTFPSRRAVFMGDNSTDVHLVNFSIKNTTRGQAEGLLLMGERYIVSNVTVVGSGDALQVNGPIYLTDSLIIGDGDTILGRGPAFFNRCELQSRGVFMWIRNTSTNHGNVFLDSTFRKLGGGVTELARAPVNNGRAYPYAEAVLINAKLEGISPVGWGAMGGDTANMRYWEYNSRNASDGTPVDISQRKLESRQLTMEKDAATIANYSNPEYVLGWKPAMAPVILSQPENVTSAAGQSVHFSVKALAVPDVTYQWFKNDVAIPAATDATFRLSSVQASDAGRYRVTAKNSSGSESSVPVTLTVK